MKLFSWGKDGGPESAVWGLWLVEIKRLFSIVLLKFENGTRDASHDHAFNSISWLLKGRLVERHLDGRVEVHRPSWKPIVTKRTTFHQVESIGRSWVLSFRGPWSATWHEHTKADGIYTLAQGRRRIQEEKTACRT